MQSSGILKYIKPATPLPSHTLMPRLSLPGTASCMERYRTPRKVKFDGRQMASEGIHKQMRASLGKVKRVYRKTPRDGGTRRAGPHCGERNTVPMAPLRDTQNPGLGDAERHALQQQQLLAESIWQEVAIHENIHGELTPLWDVHSEPYVCPPVSPEIIPVYDHADVYQVDRDHDENEACAYEQDDHDVGLDDHDIGLEMELATLQHTAPLTQPDRRVQYAMTIHDIEHQLNHAECIISIRDIDLYFIHDGQKSNP